ncbi:MAG: quinolinate synthase NadA [Methanobacteriota archaeon]|nr:MAG: quinolinate synthase NadA [Euryarchaeota archaeon]
MAEPLVVISHNYQDGPTQEISDFVYGTTAIVRNAPRFKRKKVLFCGVLYMAEDLYNMADGEVEVFIPEITVKDGVIDKPRCPMIKKQRDTDIVAVNHVEEARKLNPDLTLAYINTPSSIKAECDGVYNGTVGLNVAERIAKERNGKGRVAFIGDVNVNNWMRDVLQPKYPDFEVISIPTNDVFCPSHVNVPADFFMETYDELVKLHGENLGLEMHAEVDTPLRKFGFEKNAYFGGTGGLVRTPKESDKTTWLVGTVEGVVDRLKRETDLSIYSINMRCPNMSYTTVPRVQKAKMILETGGPIADIKYAYKDEPYYEIDVHQKEHFQTTSEGRTRIPAVKLSVSEDISKRAKTALTTLL